VPGATGAVATLLHFKGEKMIDKKILCCDDVPFGLELEKNEDGEIVNYRFILLDTGETVEMDLSEIEICKTWTV
jgi:hypothetical protein